MRLRRRCARREFLGIGLEDQFQASGGVAANLAAGDFAEKRHAHFVGHAFFGELLFGFADERDFWNGVDAVGIIGAIGMNGNAKRVGRGDTALLHGNGAEAGEADDVADGKNIGLLGAVIAVDRNAAAGVRFQAGVGAI